MANFLESLGKDIYGFGKTALRDINAVGKRMGEGADVLFGTNFSGENPNGGAIPVAQADTNGSKNIMDASRNTNVVKSRTPASVPPPPSAPSGQQYTVDSNGNYVFPDGSITDKNFNLIKPAGGGSNTNGIPAVSIPPAPDTSSVFKTLLGNEAAAAKGATDIRSGIIPVGTPQQQAIMGNEAAIAAAGATPESYQNLVRLNQQVAQKMAEITNLDNQHNTNIQNVDNTPGLTQDQAAARKNGITRQYQAQRATLSADANLLSAQYGAASGNFQIADQMAKDYIHNSTQAQQQAISDLRWADSQYSSIIQAMGANAVDLWKTNLSFQESLLSLVQKQQMDKLSWLVSSGVTGLTSEQINNMSLADAAGAAAAATNRQIEMQISQFQQQQQTTSLAQQKSAEDIAMQQEQKKPFWQRWIDQLTGNIPTANIGGVQVGTPATDDKGNEMIYTPQGWLPSNF